jgi:hypothetical protein
MRMSADSVEVSISDFSGLIDLAAFVDRVGVEGVVLDLDRTAGRGYYPSLCLSVRARFGDEMVECGDGGFVDWTQRLLSDRSERLLISGLGLDRMAALRT